jgi:hypothetical protein
VWNRRLMRAEFLLVTLKEGEHLEDLGMDGRLV